MDATLAGLLHGCAETPDDSTPHLILADWLDDHDQPARAEFVRLQCRLADWVPDWQERRELIEKQNAFLAKYRLPWLGPLLELCERVEFVRGLARPTIARAQFAREATRRVLGAVAETALVVAVQVVRTESLRRFAGLAQLEEISALSLAGLGLDNDALQPLLDSPHLERLIALDLANNRLTAPAVGRLAQALPQLVRLDLRNNRLAQDGPPALDRLLALPRLRDLDLAGNHLDGPEHVAVRATRLPAGRVMNSLGMEFVAVPAGSFRMGSTDEERQVAGANRDNEGPQHPVTLTRPFRLGRFAVTQAQIEAVLGTNPSHFRGDDRRAADSVSWEQATEFCTRLGELAAEQAAGRTYRLPTEAEWEHACRAGTFTVFHHGDALPSAELVNYDGNFVYGDTQRGPYLRRTAEVGRYPPNAFGLYEMHGNVWEWCSDRYREKAYTRKAVVDPQGPKTGGGRVRRGGCWDCIGSYTRAAHRNGQDEASSNIYTGFRVVLVE